MRIFQGQMFNLCPIKGMFHEQERYSQCHIKTATNKNRTEKQGGGGKSPFVCGYYSTYLAAVAT